MRDGVPKREAVMDGETYGVTDDANGDKRRQHGQPPTIALARIHRESCPPARAYQSARSLLPSRSVCQIGKEFTGELPQFVCRCHSVPLRREGNKSQRYHHGSRPSITLIGASRDEIVPGESEECEKQRADANQDDEETPGRPPPA
jgi:hypothetical protein